MSEQWEPTIRAFARQDLEAPPDPGAMLFTGSSTIVKWDTLAEDFLFAPVLNRGFGGSQVPDLLAYFERVILPYDPRIVVVYSGDNDIAAGRTPEQVLADYAELQGLIRDGVPGAPLVIVGLKPSPNRWHLAEAMCRVNSGLERWASGTERTEVVPVWHAMLSDEGVPRGELYSDGLHLTPAGYRVWTERLAPRLRALWGDQAHR
ncbi:MAG: hypothetical protein GF393_04810 [Armatimonadia bacterium]|nr:hypothetical protein [Armatimonadia bacterium]